MGGLEDGLMNCQVKECMGEWIDKLRMDVRKDGWMNELINGRTNGQCMGGWTDTPAGRQRDENKR